jgi:uncharacterized RDD family membrane protein YckC
MVMERTQGVRTGEAVTIEYQLAGLGSRFLAVVIDAAWQLAILGALFVAAAFALPVLVRVMPSKYLASLGIALVTCIVFLVTIGWFIIFETWWSGRTPGKRALGIRVVRDGGFPLDWGAAVIRNLVRLVEIVAGCYGLSAASALLSPENKRLGDLAAGTIVVRERSVTPPDLDAYLGGPARTDTGLREDDRILVERFLARRMQLDPAARADLARRLAARIRPTLRASYGALDDEALLEFLAGR